MVTKDKVYQRNDGRWEARYVKKITEDGKKIYGSVYGKTPEEAQAARDLLKKQFEEKLKSLDRMTMNVACSMWSEHQQTKVGVTSMSKYRSLNDGYIIPYLGDMKLINLSNKDIESFKDYLQTGIKKSLSQNTVSEILRQLKRVLTFIEDKYDVRLPKVVVDIGVQKKDMRILTHEEQTKILTYLTGVEDGEIVDSEIDDYYLAILFSLFAGLKPSELCALQWHHIDHKANVIHITRSLQRVGKNLQISTLTETTGKRDVPIAKSLKPYLLKHKGEKGYILKSRAGTQTEPRLLQGHLKRIMDKIELEDVTFSALRDTFAVRCCEAGIDIYSLAIILGNMELDTVRRKYGNYLPTPKIELNI